MNRDQKAAVIDEIAADITASQAIFAVDYRGITVAQVQELRERLRAADASFRVVKNSLTERAADKAGAEQLKELLSGPTALTFARGDAAAAAKAVADFARTTDVLAFKGGLMDGAALSSADVGAISRLPSRDVLYGQLVGIVASPIVGLARTLNALIGGLAVGLGALRDKRSASEPTAAPPVSGAETAEAAAVTEEAAADAEPGVAAVTEEAAADAEPGVAAVTEEAAADAEPGVAAVTEDPEAAIEEAAADAEPATEEERTAEGETPAAGDGASTPAPEGEAGEDTNNESDPGADAEGDDTSKE